MTPTRISSLPHTSEISQTSDKCQKLESEAEALRLELVKAQISSLYGNSQIVENIQSIKSSSSNLASKNFNNIHLDSSRQSKDDPLAFNSLKNTYSKSETSSSVEIKNAFNLIKNQIDSLSSTYSNSQIAENTQSTKSSSINLQAPSIFGKIPLDTPIWSKDDPLGFKSLKNTYRKSETSSSAELKTAFKQVNKNTLPLAGKIFHSTDDLSTICKILVESLGGKFKLD